MFGEYGELIGENTILKPGSTYTFTFDSGRIIEWRSDSWVFGKLSEYLASHATIKNIDRPLFSDRYIVVLSPKNTYTLKDFLTVMMAAWDKMGYGNISLLVAETDIGSTYPGGIPELTKEIATGAFQSIAAGIKPLLPWALIIGIAWTAIKIKRK